MSDPLATSRLRLFVAITLPEEIKERIQRAQDKLRERLPDAPIRWTSVAQFHLTLRFLGSVPSEQVPALSDSLSNACRTCGILRLEAAGMGFFPRPRAPRVLWVGISEASDALGRVHWAVQAAAAPFTAEPPETRFVGHVTLARIQRLRTTEAQALVEAAERFSGVSFGEWSASEIHLIRSELSPRGARYTTLQAFPLQGS